MPLKKLLGTAALLLGCAVSPLVFAHAHLTSATPAADATVSAPAELSLVFTEGVEQSFTKVELTRDGQAVLVKSIATQGADKKTLVVTPAAPLTAGEYTVNWHAVSVDTHKSEGTYHFKVAQ
ncbi:copper homeostasis periplasmic binding protein CopC [Pseudomonas sp.]|uniref:copper homeostasis periplasmic binding protein CopC n=1 Tax=unclassified Pseudomonas TaxID=196821 RepID=UPI003CC5837B